MYTELRRVRKAKKVAGYELSKMLGYASTATYYKKERGSINFKPEEMRFIANYFDKTIEELFFDREVAETE